MGIITSGNVFQILSKDLFRFLKYIDLYQYKKQRIYTFIQNSINMSESSYLFAIYLSHILDSVFGTEDAIRCIRLFRPISYGKQWNMHMVGSMSDGFSFANSDYDFKCWINIMWRADILTHRNQNTLYIQCLCLMRQDMHV